LGLIVLDPLFDLRPIPAPHLVKPKLTQTRALSTRDLCSNAKISRLTDLAAFSRKLHEELPMFPEFRDLISTLKTEDAHFARLFQRHNELDHQIKNMEAGPLPADSQTIETLKKEKLLLKDKLYVVLKKAATPA
jgi:uncharacterized protein YdcH (DUF465 family)